MPYAAPIADIRFALEACADFWSLRERFPELDEDTLVAILEGAGALAGETLAPLNRSGDQAGVTLKDGAVTAAPGFQEAYNAFKDGGWQGLAADPGAAFPYDADREYPLTVVPKGHHVAAPIDTVRPAG